MPNIVGSNNGWKVLGLAIMINMKLILDQGSFRMTIFPQAIQQSLKLSNRANLWKMVGSITKLVRKCRVVYGKIVSPRIATQGRSRRLGLFGKPNGWAELRRPQRCQRKLVTVGSIVRCFVFASHSVLQAVSFTVRILVYLLLTVLRLFSFPHL